MFLPICFSASLNKALAVAESKARPGFPKFGLSTISPKSPLPDPKTSINSKYWKSHFYGFGRPR